MKPLTGAGTTPKSNIVGGPVSGGFSLGILGDNKNLVSILPGDNNLKTPSQPLQETFFQKKKREEIERLEQEIALERQKIFKAE